MKNILSAMAIIAVMALSAPAHAQKSPVTVETYKFLNNFGVAFDAIKTQYVDPLTDEAIIDAAIAGMFKQLDPHSSYMSPKMMQDLRQHSDGTLTGIGAHVSQDPDTKEIVLKTMEGGPAKEAGLKSGDRIVFVDDHDIREIDLETAVGLITGAAGTDVVLKIRHENQEELESITVKRRVVNVPFIWSRVLEKDGKNMLYLKMLSFNMRSPVEVVTRIDEMVESVGGIENVDGMIFDVRFDPGGLLVSAIALCNMFMDQGLIVETRGRSEIPEPVMATEKTVIPVTVPMVVLINKYSASASEVLSGTLGQSGRAIVIGEKSYGKGSVQTTMRLPSGGGMKLTIAKYHTNNGTTPHGVGIEPDIKVLVSDDYWKEHNISDNDGTIDPQMEKALEWLACETCTQDFYGRSPDNENNR